MSIKGIKELYPKIPLSEKIKGYIALCRPFTLLAPVLAGVFGVLAPVEAITWDHVRIAVYVGVTLALLQAVGQIVNQVIDVELDKRVKPYRPLPKGIISVDEAMGLAWILTIIAVARSFTVSVYFGLMSLAILFFSVFYSLPPLSPRRVNPLLNLFWVSFSRGFLPFIATYSIYGDINEAIAYSTIALFWCLALQGTKDINDAVYDKEFGIKTVANTYGLTGLRVLAIIMLILHGVVTLALGKTLLLTVTVLGFVGVVTMNKVFYLLENNVAWAIYYIGLGLHYIVAFLYYGHFFVV